MPSKAGPDARIIGYEETLLTPYQTRFLPVSVTVVTWSPNPDKSSMPAFTGVKSISIPAKLSTSLNWLPVVRSPHQLRTIVHSDRSCQWTSQGSIRWLFEPEHLLKEPSRCYPIGSLRFSPYCKRSFLVHHSCLKIYVHTMTKSKYTTESVTSLWYTVIDKLLCLDPDHTLCRVLWFRCWSNYTVDESACSRRLRKNRSR